MKKLYTIWRLLWIFMHEFHYHFPHWFSPFKQFIEELSEKLPERSTFDYITGISVKDAVFSRFERKTKMTKTCPLKTPGHNFHSWTDAGSPLPERTWKPLKVWRNFFLWIKKRNPYVFGSKSHSQHLNLMGIEWTASLLF